VTVFTKTLPHFFSDEGGVKGYRNIIVKNFHFAFTLSLVRQILLAA
jgi:hypothetical protein